jgi:cyclophilin family peptidyl-prolyl cis-trans isomerase
MKVTTHSRVRCRSVAVVFAFWMASLGGALPAAAQDAAAKGGKPVVTLTTSLGVIEVELDAEKAPVTVENFLAYVDAGHFDGTIFHRVIPGFMIQGGGFAGDMTQKPTKAPIKNEATNGLVNARGTLAMARTNVVDSATAQFFINLKDNDFLNHSGPGPRYGYAVFGRVTKGMDVVDKIAAVPTGSKGGHQDVPKTNVVIESAKRKK